MRSVLLAAPLGRALLVLAVLALAVACRAPEPAQNPRVLGVLDDGRRAFERGRELARLGDSVRAEQYLAAALARGYAPPETLRWLLGVCIQGSRLRAAVHYATPYLAAHPEAARLRYVVATLYLGLAQPLPARDELLELLARAPAYADAHYLLGVIEWEGFGELGRAREHFDAYLARAPGGPHAVSASAWLARHADDREAAP
jgi:tetratricopeptide (TPR) repeat protein